MENIWKDNARGHILAKKTYSRPLDEEKGIFESFFDIIMRVRKHQVRLWERQLGRKLSKDENEELDRWIELVLEHKVCCSGRTMWMANIPTANKREVAHFNCSATSLGNVRDAVDIFWLLLQGCGVGFSASEGSLNGFTQKIPTIKFIEPSEEFDKGALEKNKETFEEGVWTITVGDSAKAWARLIGKVLAGKEKAHTLVFDLSNIRKAGVRLKGYGWISSGHVPLMNALEGICAVMNRRAGMMLEKIDLLDIGNWLGTTLSSRRAAEIFLFPFKDKAWRELATAKKDLWEVGNGHRGQSNNSIVFDYKPVRDELVEIFNLMEASGGSEPAFMNMEAGRKRSPWAKLANPCFSGDSRLLIEEGGNHVYRRIDSLAGRDDVTVVLPNGEEVSECKVFSNGNKEVVTFRLETGEELTCTPDHKLMTRTGGEISAENAYKEGAQVSRYKGEAVKISFAVHEGVKEVFDFSMPHTHWGVVEGIVAHNCAEILLPADGGLCNLTEVNLSRLTNFEELKEALRLTARANYRQTLVELKDGILQEQWNRNNKFLRLCGVGLTGIATRPDLKPEHLSVMREVARQGAFSMAEELGTEPPKNVTCIKPSGCRPSNALTVTDKGILTLKELLEDHPEDQEWATKEGVQALQGEESKRITKTYRNGEAEVYKISMPYGLYVESTSDHKWFVEGRWVATEDLNLGEYIHMERQTYKSKVHSELTSGRMSSELAWLVGVLSGAQVSEKGVKVSGSPDVMLKLHAIVAKHFPEVRGGVLIAEGEGVWESQGDIINEWLTANKLFSDRTVPRKVRESSYEDIIAYIAGLIDVRGSFTREQEGQLVDLTLDNLFEDQVLQNVAWASGLHLSYDGINKFDGLACTSTGEALLLLKMHSVKRGQVKGAHLRLGVEVVIVVAITPQGVQQTYDLEVEDNHWYFAGPFKSHNTLSKVFNTTEGIHKPLGRYIINNIRFGENDPLLPKLEKAGYTIVPDPTEPNGKLVKFPVKWDTVEFDKVVTEDGRELEINLDSAVKQLDMYKMYMDNWCDQNVSVTISYSPEEVPSIIDWLMVNWDSYVGVSFLYRADPTKTAEDLGYPYLPQEVVTKEVYEELARGIADVDFEGTDSEEEVFAGDECTTGACPIK